MGTKNILKLQRQFYKKLYAKDPTVIFNLENKTQIKVTEDQLNMLNEDITLQELKETAFQMTKHKTPGTDGLSAIFYTTMWEDIKEVFYEAVKTGFSKKLLHDSARREIINLIPKPLKDARRLKHLRPISLLNVDYKIIEKVLANRLKIVLDYLIHDDQKGFMAGRRISANIRRAFEVVTRAEDFEGLILSIDFSKAFDKISFHAITGALNYFGIHGKYVEMIQTCYKNITSTVQNNGFFSEPISIQTGLRQGAPNSSYLLLLCAEILAINIRDNKDIEGIPIHDILFVLSQYADDMDTFLKVKEKCIIALFDELECFRRNTGLIVNYDKTTVYRIGSLRKSNAKCYSFKPLFWTNDPINILGLWVDYDQTKVMEINYKLLMQRVKAILDQWTRRKLSLFGKIAVINTLVASQFVYEMTVLPVIHQKYVELFNQMIIDFLWEGRRPKIAIKILQAPKNCGGAGLIDIRKKDMALKVSWVQILQADQKLSEIAYAAINPMLKELILAVQSGIIRCWQNYDRTKQFLERCTDVVGTDKLYAKNHET